MAAGQPSSATQVPAAGTALPPAASSSEPARADGAAVAPQAAASAPAVAAPTPEAVRDAQRTVALEQALASLREQTARNEQTLLEMRRELAAARDSRYANPLVYALVALLLLALVALVWMWMASRRAAQSVWWPEGGSPTSARPSTFGGLDDAADTFPGEDNAGAARALAAGAAGTAAAGSSSDGIPAGFIDPDAPRSPDALAETDHSDLDAPIPAGQSLATSRSVNTEELFDVQQQAEFFLSLGQHEQAIAVLSEYVADHPDTSALAYLELLRIFHSLGRMLDYERVRRQCQQALNVRVPSFDDFHQDAGRPLDHHNEVLQRIEEHWPGPESLPVIEELLFRRPGEDGQPTFDLAAYRELLMLYAMAQEQPAGDDSQRPSLAEVLMRHQQHETLPMALPTSAVELPTAPQSLVRDTALVEPRHPDFQPTRPPHPLTASLDFDLNELDMPGVDTIPAALRKPRVEPGAAIPVIEPAALDQPSTELAPAAPDAPSALLPDLELFDPEIEESIKPGSLKR
jgi:tetratricopeptide (TPR) repeat protein